MKQVLPSDEADEVRNIYAVLRYLAETKNSVYGGVSMGYSNSNKYQDKIKGFNDRFVMILIGHIERYLTKLGIDMGVDEKIVYNVSVQNGQAIIASDNAVVNATNNIQGVNGEELKKLLDRVSECSAELGEEDKEAVAESIEVVELEIVADRPKKSMLKKQ